MTLARVELLGAHCRRDALLEAQRTERSLAHEPLLWLGLALSLLPPAYHLSTMARSFSPGF